LFADEWQKTLFVLQEQLRPGYQSRNVDFDQAPYIYSIRAMIQSIVYNLVSNSNKYRNPEKELRIDVTTSLQPDGAVVLAGKRQWTGY
jgi:signal transduction histidine kinase